MSGRFVSFIVGGERYCVPVDQVLQIIRPEGILTVPKAPSFVKGVINLRGDVIPVVSLRARLGIDDGLVEGGSNASSRARIIVIRVESRSCGLCVDEVREIVDINESSDPEEPAQQAAGEAASSARAQFIRRVAQREEGLFRILDLQRVLSAGRDPQGTGSA